MKKNGTTSIATVALILSAIAMVNCGGEATSTAGFRFSISNVSSVDTSGVLGDVVLSDCGAYVNQNQGVLGCTGPDPANQYGQYKVSDVVLADGRKALAFIARSFQIPGGVEAVVLGDRPVILIATETISIAGTLRVKQGFAGGSVADATTMLGGGEGGGAGGKTGGGGSYCAKGGAGAGSMGGTSGNTYGNTSLVPLTAGSSGGGLYGGEGGGAIQLVAGVSIAISGIVTAPGGAGGPGSGGGAGGSILIESPSVSLSGVIAANGGGGTAGTGGGLADEGQASAERARGVPSIEDNSSGGKGGAGSVMEGENGSLNSDPAYSDGNFSGSGGGSVGRIRIRANAFASTGVISPTLSSACATKADLPVTE